MNNFFIFTLYFSRLSGEVLAALYNPVICPVFPKQTRRFHTIYRLFTKTSLMATNVWLLSRVLYVLQTFQSFVPLFVYQNTIPYCYPSPVCSRIPQLETALGHQRAKTKKIYIRRDISTVFTSATRFKKAYLAATIFHCAHALNWRPSRKLRTSPSLVQGPSRSLRAPGTPELTLLCPARSLHPTCELDPCPSRLGSSLTSSF